MHGSSSSPLKFGVSHRPIHAWCWFDQIAGIGLARARSIKVSNRSKNSLTAASLRYLRVLAKDRGRCLARSCCGARLPTSFDGELGQIGVRFLVLRMRDEPGKPTSADGHPRLCNMSASCTLLLSMHFAANSHFPGSFAGEGELLYLIEPSADLFRSARLGRSTGSSRLSSKDQHPCTGRRCCDRSIRPER